MRMLLPAALLLSFGLGYSACGDDRPCAVEQCPQAVDCIPPLSAENECLCSTLGHDWIRANCPETTYSY
jgi:hypothetical protein